MSIRKRTSSDQREDAVEAPVPPRRGEGDASVDDPSEPDVVPLGPVATLIRRAMLVGVLPLFSLFYLWQALEIKVPARALVVSPRTFPVIIGALMCATAVALAVMEVRRMLGDRAAAARGEEVAPEIDDDQERITSWRDTWATVAGLIAYVATFTVLGFFVSTLLFLVALSTYFAPRRLLRNTIVSIAFSLGVYMLFVNVLNVQLPAGLLSGVM
jgi:putative tricarboxylic transport membrane protein